MPRTLTSVAAGALATAATWHATKAITVVNQGTKTFTVAGDQTADIRAGDSIVVASSTGNNGTYTVVSSTFTTVTAIVVSQSLPSAVADGTLRGQYIPTTGDSIVVNHAVSVGASVTGLNAISGSNTLTINAGFFVDAASSSVAHITVNGTLTGDSTTLVVTAGVITFGATGALTGNVDFRGGSVVDSSAVSGWSFGSGETIRMFVAITLTVQPAGGSVYEVYNSTFTTAGFTTAVYIHLKTKGALYVGPDIVSYDGPSGASSMRMGI